MGGQSHCAIIQTWLQLWWMFGLVELRLELRIDSSFWSSHWEFFEEVPMYGAGAAQGRGSLSPSPALGEVTSLWPLRSVTPACGQQRWGWPRGVLTASLWPMRPGTAADRVSSHWLMCSRETCGWVKCLIRFFIIELIKPKYHLNNIIQRKSYCAGIKWRAGFVDE